MAERRTRHHDSPRRRRRESTKSIIDQDEVSRTRAPYQPAEIPSSYSSSSSYIDISRTFPSNKPRGLGAIRAFFTSPSEHRRRPRRRTSRPYLRAGSSSSSSVNTDLAYGSGYIRRRKGDRRREKGKEREPAGRRDPREERDPNTAILEVGAGLAALARKQNRLDLVEARRQGIAPPKGADPGILKGAESSRGLASSKVSQGPDDEGWESATDADSETSSVDSRLAYGHGNSPGWGGFFRSRPKRKDSVVDPALFGPANSLHGIIHEPVGFDDVDHDNLSDYHPPTVEALRKEQNYPPQVPAPQREQSFADGSATGPLQYVYPIPTSDPTRFDAVRGSAISTQEQYGPRPAPVPIQQPHVEIRQPQPKPVVSQSVFEAPYSTRSEPKFPSSSGRTKSSVAGAALAGVAGAAIVAAASSERQGERNDRDQREGVRDQYDVERRAERQKDGPSERPDIKEGTDERREKRRESDRNGPEESREDRRERRRREKRDDPYYEKRREKRRDDDASGDTADKRREEKYSERSDDRHDERRTRKDAPIISPVNPFQYQVADDAFKTPDGTRNSEPFSSIQRARSPAVVTVERVPHWHREAATKEEKAKPNGDTDRQDRETRDSQRTEREAASLYKEIEHSTIPVEATAVGAAIAAEEHRHSREKVRKRRYDRSGDASPSGEKDPIQEEADRIYREAVLARKISESNNEDPVTRVVTPPEMAHKKDKEVLYPVPNADFELDHVMDPVEFMTSPTKGHGEDFDRIKSLSGATLEDLKRPLLTLVRPTPTPSPAPEEQKARSKRKGSSREAESTESKNSKPRRKDSSRDVEPSDPKDRTSRGSESSEIQAKPVVDTVITEAKGDTTQTPPSANGTKGVTWGENDTKHYEVESPYETKDDPITTAVSVSDNREKPKMSKERKASAWGALRGAFMSGAAAEVVAKATEASKDDQNVESDRREKGVKPESTKKDIKPEKRDSSRGEHRGVASESKHSDNEARERSPPDVGPKPSNMSGSNMPGAFDDDLDFTATLAAGLEDSGFDPNIVIKDPTYRRRSSPPGSEGLPLAGYKQPHAETVSDLSRYADPSMGMSRDIKAQDNDLREDNAERPRKKLDKGTKRQSSETRELDLSSKASTAIEFVEEPESFLESSKSGKKERKRDKTKKSKDSYDDADGRSNKRVSVPIDAFDDLRAEAVQVEVPDDWNTPKKSKKKSKRDNDQYDSPSRSMSASDMTSSMELSKKKSKDKSSKRSSQYDSEPNPEDVPLPSASEISRDDDYDIRISKKKSNRSSSTPDIVDRDARSVRSDSSRYEDDDNSRSSKKEKRNSGFFSGIFGTSTSKSEPERSKEAEESESKKRSKKSKRNSIGDGSEIYGDVKSDVKTSPNGNGYKNHDGDTEDPKSAINGDNKHGKADEKEESFLDNAGTLGAGVGVAAAIALASQHQQTKAATAEIEERVSRGYSREDISPASTPAVEASREVVEDFVDPEIIQRQFRPSIDPQYGDLLLLPPSDPGSPNLEADHELPSLPESRPNTPPKAENITTRDRSIGSSRRSELPALVKTPSHSAVPIKFFMGNRSTPSSPGLVRAPSISSPSTMSPDTLSSHRARPRPTSWDSTKEIQPLYLLDPSRRAPASQSTDSEVQSPVSEDATKSVSIEKLMHVSEATLEERTSDIRNFAEEREAEQPKLDVQEDQIHIPSPAANSPDPTTTLLKSQVLTPMGRVAHEFNFSSLPPLPESGASTPKESTEPLGLPQLPDSRSSTMVEDRSLEGSDLVTADLLTGAALGLSADAMALPSSHDEPVGEREAVLKSTSTVELPAEFQIEPITKDRSSYLFQATPPAKRIRDMDSKSPLEMRQMEVASPFQIVGEVSRPDDSSTSRVVTHDREATLEALTRPLPNEEKPLDSLAVDHPLTTRELEADGANEFSFMKHQKNENKDKGTKVDHLRLEDGPSSVIAPPSIVDSSNDTEVAPEFMLKRSKKDKKKDKKRASSQPGIEDESSKIVVLEPAVAATPQERDFVNGPSQSLSDVALLSSAETAPEESGTVEEFLKKSKKDKKKGTKGAPYFVKPDDEASPNTAMSSPVSSIVKPADSITEPVEPLSTSVLASSTEEAEVLDIGAQHSLEKANQDNKQYLERALDSTNPKDDASASSLILPPTTSTSKEAETVDEPSQPFPGVALPSSIEPADHINTPLEFLPKKSRKNKKNKKKALDWNGGGEEVSPSSASPSSAASAAQEPAPPGLLSMTHKNDERKDGKNLGSIFRSSTLMEPSGGDPTEVLDAKDKDVSSGEQSSLPLSRVFSEAETPLGVGKEDLMTIAVLPSQEENLQIAEPHAELPSIKESKKGKNKGRKPLPSWEFDEPSTSEVVASEPIAERSLEREADKFGSESKHIIDIRNEPQIEPQVETEFVKDSEGLNNNKSKPQHDQERGEQLVSGPTEDEPVEQQPILSESLRNKSLQDESVEDEQVQKDTIEARLERDLSVLDKPTEKEIVEQNSSNDFRMPEAPIKEHIDNRNLADKGSSSKDIASREDDDHGKPIEPISEPSSVKDSKRNKKKKGKYFKAWQDEEVPASQPIVDPVSEPATEVPSEREDFSGFSTPPSQTKGKKKQKRKSIAWGLEGTEPILGPDAMQGNSACDLTTHDAPTETEQGNENTDLIQHEVGEPNATLKGHGVKEGLGHFQNPEPHADTAHFKPKEVTEDIENSLPNTRPDAPLATLTESNPFGTALSSFSGMDYFPSAAALHSPRFPEKFRESAETGYFPSAVRLQPAAAPLIGTATSFKAPEIAPIKNIHTVVAEPPGKDIHHEHVPIDENSTQSQEVPAVDAMPLPADNVHHLAKPISAEDLPKQTHVEYFPPASSLHSPSSTKPRDGGNGKGYFPSATALLPLVGAAAVLTEKYHHEQQPSSKDVREDKELLISHPREYDEPPLLAADHGATETTFVVPEKNVSDSMSQVAEEEDADTKTSTLYSEEQLQEARQLNAEFGSNKKKSKKSRKSRADLSRTLMEDENLPTATPNEPEDLKQQIEPNREIPAVDETQTPNDLGAGYKEDQVALAKQPQAEYDFGARRSKKGKKSRDTSSASRDYDTSSSVFEAPEAVDNQPEEGASLGIMADSGKPSRQRDPDLFAAGFAEDQLQSAREMREAFATGGSKKSKKDKKRKSLARSATDENISGPTAEAGSDETSLATTEVDSATDSPYHLSTVPTPQDFESSFTTKKGKKEKKRQSLLRSVTQESEDSTGTGREITVEPEQIEYVTPHKDVAKAADASAELIIDPEIEPSSTIAEEVEAFSMKKGKKGRKKRESLLRTTTGDVPSPEIDAKTAPQETAEATTSQPPDVMADDDMAALGEELNFNLKKSKKGKRGGKWEDADEAAAEKEDTSQLAEQNIAKEANITPENDFDQRTLADRIWAGVMPSESIQLETENLSAVSEDPLGLHTIGNQKKTTKGQANLALVSEHEPVLADHDDRDPSIANKTDNKDLPISWVDGMDVAKAEKKQPKLFDAWSFSSLPLDKPAKETTLLEPRTETDEIEGPRDVKQEDQTDRRHSPLLVEEDYSTKALVQEQHRTTEDAEPIDGLETPPPVMPKILAWEDEPTMQEEAEISENILSVPILESLDNSDVKGKVKPSIAKPVSASILAAGAALLAGTSTGPKVATETEALSIDVSRSAIEVNKSRLVESEKKKEKRPAKLLDRRSLPKDDLFDDPMLWEGAEAQRFGDHAIEDQSGDDVGFWSTSVENEESSKDEFAVEDVEDGPSMPQKRERSESLMEVLEPSTALDHTKTPRKHQYEDVSAAIARDTIVDQETAAERLLNDHAVIRDLPENMSAQIDKPELASQHNDLPVDSLAQSSKKPKVKKQSRLTAQDGPAKDEEVGAKSSYDPVVEPSTSKHIDTALIDDMRPPITQEATSDPERKQHKELKPGSPFSPAPTSVSEEERLARNSPEREKFQPSTKGHEDTKNRHRRQEMYIPPSSTMPRAIEDESMLQKEANISPSHVPTESRSKDKHRRQESYLPLPPNLPVVIEEEDHKPDSKYVPHERVINDNNRDSAFVTESPVPFQRRFPEDHEYARDSGVHLRDWGDTPVSKDKPHVTSADDALARLSWPVVDEETETVNLRQSQRPRDERSPKGHAANSALVGAGADVTVTELAHLAARGPSQTRDDHGVNAKFDRSITPNMGRLQTPDHSKYRPGSVGSNRSSGTPPLRRSDRKLSGDLRSLSQRSQANLAKEAKDAREAERSPATSIINVNPTANEGRPRVKDMADVYDGYGEGRIGSPMSPTRPHSMRRRQSMQVLDLEARLEQLAAENRMLAEAKELAEHSLQSSQRATLALADRDAEVDSLKQTLEWLRQEVERLKEVNDGLTSANVTLGRQHNERYGALESQHADTTRDLEDLRQTHRGLSGGVEDVVMERVSAATQDKDREIAQLRLDLEAAHERIREMQREILRAKDGDNGFLVFKDEDYFDNACQQLCQHVQQWVLRFSKFSDMRACRRTNEINEEKIIDRLDNAVLDGSDVDEYLSDRVKRRDIFMSMTMTMIWEFVFTRYLFGMDREQRQKLKSLEKTLLEVGPPAAVHQWRATTLTLLSKRDAFQQQREKDTVAVVQMIFQTLSEILPPPTHLEEQIQEQLTRVMKAAVDLSIEMRTQRAEYMMLPPLQPEYDANGDLARQVQFNAALMNERSGDTVSNEELEAQHAVVRIVLFPLVVKKGDDTGGGDDEIVVCPAQVLVAKPRRHARGLTPEGMGQNPNHSRVSMQSSMPVDQQVPDI